MKCPSCAAAELVHDTRDMPYTYKGESTIIPAVTGDFCPACDESILNADESRRTMNFMLEFNKQVNASIVDPGFITSVSKKLGLD
jgi:HTH-type transcriptional regulator/antitoxin MqsA